MAVHILSAPARMRAARNLALLTGLFAAVLVPLPEWVESTLVIGSLANAFHGVLFAAITLFLLSRSKLDGVRGYIAPLLIAVVLAVATEVVQGLGPRDPSWSDLRTDLLGIAAATAFARLGLERRMLTQPLRVVWVSVALAAIAVILAPVLIAALRWAEHEQRFPVLFSANFSDVLNMTESVGESDEVKVSKDVDGVDVVLRSGSFPGIVISKFASDWKGREALIFDVENPSRDPIALEFHVRDRGSSPAAWADRFNIRSTLAPGVRQSIRVPLTAVAVTPSGRKMRMDAIAFIAAYRVAPGGDRFTIHSIRLE